VLLTFGIVLIIEHVASGSINIFKGNLERLRQSTEIDLYVGN